MDKAVDTQNNNSQGDNQFSESVENIKKIYKTTKKIVEVARWLFNFFPGGPLALGGLIIILLAALFFMIVMSGLMQPIPGGKIPTFSSKKEEINGLTLELTGPTKINNGENLEYKITISYNPTIATVPLSSIIVYEILPPNTTFVSAKGAFTNNNGQIEWPMSQNDNTITFIIKPSIEDAEIENTVYAKVDKSLLSTANINSCSGKYDLSINDLKANFGDPSCDFDKDELYTLLKNSDPQYADGWYFKLIYCETGGTYNPNAFNSHSTSGTAWGMYQMGHEEYPSLNIPRQMNNEYDRGDVDWRTQTSNAISYNNQRGNDFAYWGCKPF